MVRKIKIYCNRVDAKNSDSDTRMDRKVRLTAQTRSEADLTDQLIAIIVLISPIH